MRKLSNQANAPSGRSLFRIDTASMGVSTWSIKSDNNRKGSQTSNEHAKTERRLVSWATTFQRLRRRSTVQHINFSRSFQKRSHFPSDALVAILEIAILVLSMIQLEMSSRSPRWRENRACLQYDGCTTLVPEGSFKVVNALRIGIVILSLVRGWLRVRYLRNKATPSYDGIKKTLRGKLTKFAPYGLEFLFTFVIPYPGLEEFVPREQVKVLVLLSVAVVVRTVFWRHFLYFPYPIRQKGKVACFTGNLEFTYHEFVLKKVFDDDPLTKIVLIYALFLALMSFLIHVVESAHGACYWQPTGLTVASIDGSQSAGSAENMVCFNFSWRDALWLTATAFLSIVYRDVAPHSYGGRLLIAMSACIIKCVSALLFSVIIKKIKFSTMEARVHSFLFRMELNAKKDLTAVMAVQATFRFNKSYKQSLIWHQQDHSHLYFRPLSARLPNEVKKKLYVSRFQARLKEIMKYNTDGDLLNGFTKHIEVITAALGITFIEMATLKKIYYHKSRILEDRRRRAKQNSSRSSSLNVAGNEGCGSNLPSVEGGREMISSLKGLGIAARVRTFTQGTAAAAGSSVKEAGQSTTAVVTALVLARQPSNLQLVSRPSFSTNQWQSDMMRKCEETLMLLQKIQTTAQSIR